MTQQGVSPAPSTGQLSAVLDHAPVAICVSAADSRELLYANALAKRLFPHEGTLQGITCYQAAGFDAPCPFCQADRRSCRCAASATQTHSVCISSAAN